MEWAVLELFMSVRPLYVFTKIRISVEMPKKGGVFKAIGADSRRAGSDEMRNG